MKKQIKSILLIISILLTLFLNLNESQVVYAKSDIIVANKNYTVVGVLLEPGLFELKYILPVLKKMDIYVVVNRGLSGADFWLMDAVEAGIEVFVYGVSVSGKNRKELMDYLDKNG